MPQSSRNPNWPPVPEQALPDGVLLHDLNPSVDARGVLTEIYREAWLPGVPLTQWNTSHCTTNSLRGMHLHLQHSDYLVVHSGQFVFGLRDLRPRSLTFGLKVLFELKTASLFIPPGVLHGFYCLAEGSLVYGMTHGWDIEDDLACRWDDPGHGLVFPTTDPILSSRDQGAASFGTLQALFADRCP